MLQMQLGGDGAGGVRRLRCAHAAYGRVRQAGARAARAGGQAHTRRSGGAESATTRSEAEAKRIHARRSRIDLFHRGRKELPDSRLPVEPGDVVRIQGDVERIRQLTRK